MTPPSTGLVTSPITETTIASKSSGCGSGCNSSATGEMDEKLQQRIANHPCYSEEAHHHYARLHAFPGSIVTSLINYLFSGFQTHKWKLNKAFDQSLNFIWQEVRSKLHNIPSSESVIATGDKIEARKLNKLDSEYWLFVRITELITAGVNVADKDLIDWKLSELDEQRDIINDRLQPLKKRYYSLLSTIQDVWHSCYAVFTLEAIRREKGFKIIEKILTDLLIAYIAQEPSKENIQEMLEVLDEKLTKNPRLKTLYQTSRLLNWVYSYIGNLSTDVDEDPIYKDYPVRARHD